NGDGQREPKGEPRSQVKIVIPADHSMVSLLGSGDELLHVIEREFDADIHVRGNEITATGTPAETALVTALFDELVELLRKGTDLIDKHTIVFAIGPAGTGKTYLAMAKAVKALQAKEVNRIILTRPAVEAG